MTVPSRDGVPPDTEPEDGFLSPEAVQSAEGATPQLWLDRDRKAP